MSTSYYHTKESVEEYIKLSVGYDGSFLINKLKSYLADGARILELGSAEGKDIILLKTLGYQVTGSDCSEVFLDLLRRKHPDLKLLHLDAATIETNDCFDSIYSNKVLHHLTDDELERSICRQFSLLNDNGIICHSFWNGVGEETFKGMHVNYHTVTELSQLLSYRFDLLHIETYAEMDKDDSLFIIARKKIT